MRALILSLLTIAGFSSQAETFKCVGMGEFAAMGTQTLDLAVNGEAYRTTVAGNSIVIGVSVEDSQESLIIMVLKTSSASQMVYGAAGSADKTVTYNEFALNNIMAESNSIACSPAK